MRRKIMCIFAFLLTLFSIDNLPLFSQTTDVQTVNEVNTGREKLFNHPAWKSVVQEWKKISSDEVSETYSLDDVSRINDYLYTLVDAGLLSNNEEVFLSQHFSFNLSSKRPLGVSCYMSGNQKSYNEIKTTDDLRQQYKMLQQLIQSGKIDQITYQNVKNNINNDLQELSKWQTYRELELFKAMCQNKDPEYFNEDFFKKREEELKKQNKNIELDENKLQLLYYLYK